MTKRLFRAEMLLGTEFLENLKTKHVAVFGLGGVGSWCAEALARSGIGRLSLIDEDDIGETNINRQIIALGSTIGKSKAQVMAERILDINPDCEINIRHMRYEASTRDQFDFASYDYIADCIDLVSCKIDLIKTAIDRDIPILSALGTGNKLRSEMLTVCDISKTHSCPLARVVRRELKAVGIYKHRVVFSPEKAVKPEQKEAPPPGRRSVPGSVAWVPATAGLLMAQEIVLSLGESGTRET
ncbi:tRNA threonylcarbamoyladenosine dehydratase [Clostridiaceae bacterium OttesenSCG-928-D20]|nr:tRNA threonylcarbamoyladenosine dehydratase [Clostridiaceae bacterium OttesenSCG-928-D20]